MSPHKDTPLTLKQIFVAKEVHFYACKKNKSSRRKNPKVDTSLCWRKYVVKMATIW